MTKNEKGAAIEQLKAAFEANEFFYVADASTLPADKTTELRRALHAKGIKMQVVKNTLARKALEQLPSENNYAEIFESLKGATAILFTETANAPAKVIKEFRGKEGERPILKAAYISSSIYVGDDKLELLSKLKSREELVSDVLTLLQSPMQNLLSGLKSGGAQVAGLLKTLEEREA
ncbi:50S ribosomal protein L10 [Neolewinella antarctica]|uniref:Large ribosomal subunit protein uL10 n=1 Tax=Neolewinella antarctica TaxID=442734 RepID=A0ABX0X888_9BACT|nr:50S ribosomal protein L10 [Neolewinella antarctica]NJC25437.1 large subunit ribosomal protein L10 [Neolewinella antarctica]